MARPTCRKLLAQLVVRAVSREACTAGTNNPTSMPRMATTTSSYTRLKAFRFIIRSPKHGSRNKTADTLRSGGAASTVLVGPQFARTRLPEAECTLGDVPRQRTPSSHVDGFT